MLLIFALVCFILAAAIFLIEFFKSPEKPYVRIALALVASGLALWVLDAMHRLHTL